ncbi:MAG: aminopeptidase P family N-terminal domain-containing protein, partial [Thermodesulfobacteriota bacterium]
MKTGRLSGLLITRPENRRYLSGYKAADTQLDESSGFLLITTGDQFLFTDFRYDIQARKEARGFEVRLYQANPARSVGETVKALKLTRLGFEEDFLTVKFHRLLKEQVNSADLLPRPGLGGELRRR